MAVWCRRGVTLAVAVLAVWLGLLPFRLPAGLPPDAGPQVFSAGRALQWVHLLAQSPRAPGQAGHEWSRDQLLAVLRSLGLRPEVRRAAHPELAAGIENILARLPGQRPGAAILLVSHYDSEAHTPGGGDNASGVAVVLETLRTLHAGPALRNDVWVLLSDAEEAGMLGASAVAANPAGLEDARLVINVDTVVYGPAILWQTGPQNGWLVDAFGRSVAAPYGYSWVGEISSLLALDTDFSPFAGRGYSGYNFSTAYLYPEIQRDTDRSTIPQAESVQHAGETLTALVRHLGDRDLGQIGAPDEIFFGPGAGLFVHYPARWALPLAALGGAGVLALLAWGLRRRLLRGRGLLFGLLAHLSAALPLLLLAFLTLIGLGYIHLLELPAPGEPLIDPRHVVEDGWTMLALGGVVLALAVWYWRWLRRQVGPADLAVSGLVCWALLALVSAWYLPGSSYLFLWPLVAVAAAQGAMWRLHGRRRVWGRVSQWLALALVLALWTPAVYLLFLMSPLLLPVLLPAWGLLLTLLLPVLDSLLV